MISARLCTLKHIVFAIAAVVLTLVGVEISLRVRQSYTQDTADGGNDRDSLIARSWTIHHELKPLRTATTRNPDGQEPVTFATNSLGLRGPEVAIPKPPGVYRVICLGDETTADPGCEAERTFAHRLGEYLQTRTARRVEVINAGVPGYCPLLSYLQLKHSLLGLSPDLVVLSFDMSDVADDYRYRRNATLGADGEILACPHPLLERKPPAPVSEVEKRCLLACWCRTRLGGYFREKSVADDKTAVHADLAKYAWLRDEPPDWSIHISQALSPIEPIQRLAAGAGASFVLAVSPTPWQVSSTASSGPGVRAAAGVPEDVLYHSRVPFQLLGEYAQQQGVAFVDASPTFSQDPNPDDLFWKNAPRLSERGHDLYARVIASFIVRHGSALGFESQPGAQPAPTGPRPKAVPLAERRKDETR